MAVLQGKPVENASLGAGAAVAVAAQVAQSFHVHIPAEAVVAAPLAIGAIGHLVTFTKQFLSARKAKNAAAVKADEANAVAEMVRTLRAIEVAKATAPGASVEQLAAAAAAQLAAPQKPALPSV